MWQNNNNTTTIYTFKSYDEDEQRYVLVFIQASSMVEAKNKMRLNGHALFFPFKIPNVLNNPNFSNIRERFIEIIGDEIDPYVELRKINARILAGDEESHCKKKLIDLMYSFYESWGIL